jgi:hypothetical protein
MRQLLPARAVLVGYVEEIPLISLTDEVTALVGLVVTELLPARYRIRSLLHVSGAGVARQEATKA